jgi:hypothetical protein
MPQKQKQQPEQSLVCACNPPDEVRSGADTREGINIQMGVEGDHGTSNGAFD